MENLLFICIFFISNLITSLFSAGGSILTYAILGLFIDIKLIILINLYTSLISNIFIILTDKFSIRFDIVVYVLKYSLIGLLLGIFSFNFLNLNYIAWIYGIFGLLISLKNLFYKNFFIKLKILKIILFISGFIQGLLGIGGPICILCVKQILVEKSQIRSTMNIIFFIYNIIRILMLYFIKSDNIINIFMKWWLILPVFCGVQIGYILHKKISQNLFDKTINYIIFISNILYILKLIQNSN